MNIIDSVRHEILNIQPYKGGRSPRPTASGNQIKLSSNENSYGSSPLAIQAISDELAKGLSLYPDSKMTELRNSVVQFWARRQVAITRDMLLFGDGSGEVLNMCISGFVRENDRVIIPKYSFALYRMISISKGAQVIEVDRQKDHFIDLSAISQVAKDHKPRMIILANPDNPTSTFYSSNKIEDFVRTISENTALVIDEAYIHFAELENSAIKLLNSYPNLIIVHTFSKAYGLAGLRVGYGVMNSQIAELIERIRLPFNLGSLSQVGAIAALENDDFLKSTISNVQEQRAYLIEQFNQLGLPTAPAYANFIFVDLKAGYKEIYNHLENNGITVRSLDDFGFDARYARITVGTKEQNEYLIEKLKEIL